ncbi:MAG: alanine racemase, partial [Candidatus Thiodiazotropha endolucinida]
MGYAPQAIIDHAALRHNLKRAKAAAKGRKVWAVIKADGYGHGMLRVA